MSTISFFDTAFLRELLSELLESPDASKSIDAIREASNEIFSRSLRREAPRGFFSPHVVTRLNGLGKQATIIRKTPVRDLAADVAKLSSAQNEALLKALTKQYIRRRMTGLGLYKAGLVGNYLRERAIAVESVLSHTLNGDERAAIQGAGAVAISVMLMIQRCVIFERSRDSIRVSSRKGSSGRADRADRKRVAELASQLISLLEKGRQREDIEKYTAVLKELVPTYLQRLDAMIETQAPSTRRPGHGKGKRIGAVTLLAYALLEYLRRQGGLRASDAEDCVAEALSAAGVRKEKDRASDGSDIDVWSPDTVKDCAKRVRRHLKKHRSNRRPSTPRSSTKLRPPSGAGAI